MAQDDAAETQVGLHVEQLAWVAIANHARPERHHLHVATGTHAGDGVLAERAFHLDQPEHQRHIEPGALGFVPHGLQEVAAHLPVGLTAAQTVAHGAEPAQVMQTRLGREELGLWRCLVGNGGTERSAHRIHQRLLQLPSSVGRARQRQPRGGAGHAQGSATHQAMTAGYRGAHGHVHADRRLLT